MNDIPFMCLKALSIYAFNKNKSLISKTSKPVQYLDKNLFQISPWEPNRLRSALYIMRTEHTYKYTKYRPYVASKSGHQPKKPISINYR